MGLAELLGVLSENPDICVTFWCDEKSGSLHGRLSLDTLYGEAPSFVRMISLRRAELKDDGDYAKDLIELGIQELREEKHRWIQDNRAMTVRSLRR